MNTVVIMVSVGNRGHRTDYTFPPLSKWATKHGYTSVLLKLENNPLKRAPHYNKLLAHKSLPGFDRYIVVDDDLIFRQSAPALPDIPKGYVGLAICAEQENTFSDIVKWNANTGFIYANKESLYLLEEAYDIGENEESKKVWPGLDQSILNLVLFQHEKIIDIGKKWNYQPVCEYFMRGKGWRKWISSKWYRLTCYLYLASPFKNKHKKALKEAYAIHLTRSTFIRFFATIFS